MNSTRRAVRAALGAFAFLTLLAACTAPRSKTNPSPSLSAGTPMVSAGFVLAPVRGDAELELQDMAAMSSPAVILRRAWILLETGKAQESLDTTAEVLYGTERPTSTEEAYARYIRSEAYTKLGQADRGKFDHDRALELALDPELRRRLGTGTPVASGAPSAHAANNAVLAEKRSAWNPIPPVTARLDPMGKAYRITVHHSAMYFRDTSLDSSAAQIRLIQHSHMLGKDPKWGDIGYHYLIDPSGRIWEGRSMKWQGAHARGDNNIGNIGICVLGNFVHGREGQKPTTAQLDSLRQLLASMMSQYGIGADQIYRHRDFVQTECPGPYMESALAGIISELKGKPGAGGHLAARD